MKKSSIIFDGYELELLISAIKGGCVDAYYCPLYEAVLDVFISFFEQHSKDGKHFTLTLEADDK